MSFPNNPPDLNDLLTALQAPSNDSSTGDDTDFVPATVDEFLDLQSQYTKSINQVDEAIANAQMMLKEASDLARQVGNPEYLDSYAGITKSLADLFKTRSLYVNEYHKVVNSNKQKEDDRVFKREMELLKIDAKANALALAEGGAGKGNTFIQNNFALKATNADIFDSLYGNDEEKKAARDKIRLTNEIKEAEIVSN